MANEVKRADVSALVSAYNAICASVTFTQGSPGGTGTLPVNVANLSNPIPEKVTLASIKSGVDDLFSKFSSNCDCLTNTDCNQTCQTTTCQLQCAVLGNQAQCNATSNQACQTTTCQTQCTSANQGQCSTGNQGQCSTGNQGCQANQSNQSNCNCNCNCCSG